MRICFVSPYLPDHTGGGEKYLLDCAITLADTHQVSIAIREDKWQSSDKLKQKYEDFFGKSLSQIEFIPSPIFTAASFWKKITWTQKFDVVYYQTDGSLFFSLAKRNILHIQIPFTDKKTSLVDRLKLLNWQIKNTNSEFTKAVVENAWQTKIDTVHYPMINLAEFTPAKGVTKQKVILSVGRFFRHLHSKRQDILVEIFRQMTTMSPAEMKGWKLVLVGSVEDEGYFSDIKAKSQGLAIEFLTSISHQELINQYLQASIYWHAAGFEVDQTKNPEKVEHFGISTVEAMASGCLPIVCGKGGQLEIMSGELQKLTWQTVEECADKSLSYIKDWSEAKQLLLLSQQRAAAFGPDMFKATLTKMIEGQV